MIPGDGQLPVRPDDIDAIGLQFGRVVDLMHGHRGTLAEDFGEVTWVVGGQVDDHDIGDAQIIVYPAEEFLQCTDTTRRRTDRADRRRFGFLIHCYIHIRIKVLVGRLPSDRMSV